MANHNLNPHVKMNIIRKYDFRCIYCYHCGSQANPLTADPLVKRALERSFAKKDIRDILSKRQGTVASKGTR